MAIVISKNSALNDDFWKPIGQVVNAVMADADAEKSDYDAIVKDLAIEKKSDKYGEKQTGLTTLSSFSVKDEGDKAELDDMQETFPKLIVHSTFSKSVAITKEMADDAQFEDIKAVAKNLVLAAKRTRAELATRALVTEGSAFTMGGKSLDKTTGDGLSLFSTAHLAKKSGVGTQSNVFTNAFSADALFALANVLRNFKSDSGEVTGFTANKLIIPGNCPALEKAAKTLISSDLQPGTNNNDINIQKGVWTLVVDPLWQAAPNTAPYIIMSDEANKAYNGTVFYDRTALDIQNDVDIDSRNLKYNGFMRISCGFNNWRHVLLGGASSGTEYSLT